MFNAFLNGAGRDDEVLHEAAQAALDVLVEEMTTWRQTIGERSLPVREAAAVIWSAVHGLVMLTLDRQLGKLVQTGNDPRAMLDLVVETTLAGITAERKQS